MRKHRGRGRPHHLRALILASGFSLLAFSACSSSESGSSGTKTCVPGESLACTGPAACAGFQLCNAKGTAFAGCQCGGIDGSAAGAGGVSGSGGNGASAGTSGVAGTGGGTDASVDGGSDSSASDASADAMQDVSPLPFDAPGDVGKSACGQCVIQKCHSYLCDATSDSYCQTCIDGACLPGCTVLLQSLVTCAKLVCGTECCS